MLFLRACLKLRVVLPDRKWDSMQTYIHLWPTSLKSSNRKFLRIRTFESKPVSALCWAGCGGDISLLSSLVIYWPIILIFICNKLNVCLYLNVFKCFNAHIDNFFFSNQLVIFFSCKSETNFSFQPPSSMSEHLSGYQEWHKMHISSSIGVVDASMHVKNTCRALSACVSSFDK